MILKKSILYKTCNYLKNNNKKQVLIMAENVIRLLKLTKKNVKTPIYFLILIRNSWVNLTALIYVTKDVPRYSSKAN